MNRLQQLGIGLAVFIVLVFLVSGAYVRPVEPQDQTTNINLAMRQIAHELLRFECDSTSTIPPVKEMSDGRWVVNTRRSLSYDHLIEVGPAILRAAGITDDYSLALENCVSNEIILGFRASLLDRNSVACGTRELENQCFNLSLEMHPEVVKATPYPVALIILLLLLPALLLWSLYKKRRPTLQPSVLPTSTPPSLPTKNIQLSPLTQMDEKAQTLKVAEQQVELTYREMKLLLFLHENLNEVLDRSYINEAVWGSEGLIVGRSLDVFISRLRKKLKADPNLKIMTVHGIGYKLTVA